MSDDLTELTRLLHPHPKGPVPLESLTDEDQFVFEACTELGLEIGGDVARAALFDPSPGFWPPVDEERALREVEGSLRAVEQGFEGWRALRRRDRSNPIRWPGLVLDWMHGYAADIDLFEQEARGPLDSLLARGLRALPGPAQSWCWQHARAQDP